MKEASREVFENYTPKNKVVDEKIRIFYKKYPFKKVKDNPFLISEATGYLKALQDNGCNKEWVAEMQGKLFSAMVLLAN